MIFGLRLMELCAHRMLVEAHGRTSSVYVLDPVWFEEQMTCPGNDKLPRYDLVRS